MTALALIMHVHGNTTQNVLQQEDREEDSRSEAPEYTDRKERK